MILLNINIYCIELFRMYLCNIYFYTLRKNAVDSIKIYITNISD